MVRTTSGIRLTTDRATELTEADHVRVVGVARPPSGVTLLRFEFGLVAAK